MLCTGQNAWAQAFFPGGKVHIPDTSIPSTKTLGIGSDEPDRAHTNISFFLPAAPIKPAYVDSPGKAITAHVETPASIACIYRLVRQSDGCNPAKVRANFKGGGGLIVIVSAYHAPNIQKDFAIFNEQFNLPQSDLSVVYANGKMPREDPSLDKGWEIESHMDVQWAHAMAPGARIVLVEAESFLPRHLQVAIETANKLVAKNGGGQISMSWGLAEYSDQRNLAKFLAQPGAVYFAASGDNSKAEFPATHSQVVAVGGTTILRDSSGKFLGEAAWEKSGAGLSSFESRPPRQSGLNGLPGKNRGVSDIAAVGDVRTGGLFVYASRSPLAKQNGGWIQVAGTSSATVIVAAIVNAASASAKKQHASTGQLLDSIYKNIAQFKDVTVGKCTKFATGVGWDFCTGVGTPNGQNGFF